MRSFRPSADHVELQADKAAAGASGGFSLFGGKTEKWENAADLYTQAANAFRMQKQGKPPLRLCTSQTPALTDYVGKEAGLAFERAATIQTKNLSEPDDAANTLQEAYKAYRKTDPEDAARVLQQASKMECRVWHQVLLSGLQ